MVDGLPLSGLDESEADEAIEKLNRGELTSDNIPETARTGWPRMDCDDGLTDVTEAIGRGSTTRP